MLIKSGGRSFYGCSARTSCLPVENSTDDIHIDRCIMFRVPDCAVNIDRVEGFPVVHKCEPMECIMDGYRCHFLLLPSPCGETKIFKWGGTVQHSPPEAFTYRQSLAGSSYSGTTARIIPLTASSFSSGASPGIKFRGMNQGSPLSILNGYSSALCSGR